VIKYQDLSIDERLRLVENLWADIAADNEALKLTPDQRAELDRRLDAYEVNRNPGRRASEVLDDIHRRL
jgi:putative addiction module component (TIGR02574 family)